MNTSVNVLFEVPARIANGIEDGSMIRRGGVIQWAGNPSKGRVVGWLRESGGLTEHLQNSATLSPDAAAQFTRLGMSVNTVLGVQALTLGVVAVGFAVINKKLNAIDRKLDDVLAGLDDVRREVAWIDERQDIALLARTSAALETAAWSETTGRFDGLQPARAALVESGLHYEALMLRMLRAERAYRLPHVYAAYSAMFALTYVGRSQIDTLLDGSRAGFSSLDAAAKKLDGLRADFQEPLRDFTANMRQLLTLGPGAPERIGDALKDMREAQARVQGYASEFQFCAERELTFREWKSIGADDRTPRLLVLEPKG